MARWFDRSFDLGLPVSDAGALFERLYRTPDRLQEALRSLPQPILVHTPEGRWSIQEHAGHLLDLEPLWDQRLDDFEAGAAVLHAADIGNRKTHEAGHNERAPDDLTDAFRAARIAILARLERMSPDDLSRVAIHPRLQQPMSVVDLCLFVAEHDDHHLGTIAELAERLGAMPVYAVELINIVDRAVVRLAAMEDDRTLMRPAPGKWSPREIIGHLVDSASNNHQRFVRAMFQDDLVFAGYAQDDWVAAQQYQAAPWADLITLWSSFNRHLARVMASVPESIRLKPHARHNFDRLAFNTVPADVPATLDYFMDDYVRHLEHHLRQIP
ncbi:MAG: DinB family protein [Vicinamibacterales bacterium]